MNLNEQCDRVSVAITLPHKSGALYNILKNFTDKNLSMLKIESRPIVDKSWEYSFYIDFYGNIIDENVCNVLKDIKKKV